MLLTFLLSFAASSAAQQVPASGEAEEARLSRYCQQHACRLGVDFSLKKSGGGSQRIQKPLMPPAIQSKFLNVLPGEKVEAVLVMKDGQFAGWRAPTPADDAKVHRIFVDFRQNEGDAGMRAEIRHSGPTRLKLDLGIIRLEGNQQPEHTSSCPLVATGAGVESWSFPIYQLLVGTARQLDDTAQVACE